MIQGWPVPQGSIRPASIESNWAARQFVSRIGEAATKSFVKADWIEATSDATVKYLPVQIRTLSAA